jgi:hypothetical protein
MAKIKSTIKEAIASWNKKNPTLRKKTLGSIAAELGISTSALSQIESSAQFQKHFLVILESNVNSEKMNCFAIYKKIDIPIINKLSKITELLDCQIYDLVKRED